MKFLTIVPILLTTFPAQAQEQSKRWKIDVETGLTATRYNNARVPKTGGSDLDLAGLIGKNWRSFARVSLLYEDRAGGTWKLLYAPFRQAGSGILAGQTSFAGKNFGAGPAEAVYQFDSYRLTYRKPWKGGWAVGATLKVRDAEIRLTQGGMVASERNLGFVPLLNVFGEGDLCKGFQYEFELDGLVGGPGRAIDLSLRAKRPVGPSTTAFVGFRVLEGGADVPRVKNFAWVSYLTIGATVRF